jgi:energy-coupling factor transporter ATP-binding protein EcfA2
LIDQHADLDMQSIDALADALNNFSGGVVLVSHDFRLIDQVAKEVWVVDENKVSTWCGCCCQPALWCNSAGLGTHNINACLLLAAMSFSGRATFDHTRRS